MKTAFSHLVRELVLSQIVTGKTLTEEMLAERLGVSRTPVREALGSLEEQGLVRRRKNSGISLREPTLKEVVEVYDLRTALEGMAARILTGHLDRRMVKELTVLSDKLERLREEGKTASVHTARLELAFHQKLVNFCGNSHLKRVTDGFHVLTMSFRLSNELVYRRSRRYSHQRIIDALVKRNPDEAERVTRMHIQEGKEFLLRQVLGPSTVLNDREARGKGRRRR